MAWSADWSNLGDEIVRTYRESFARAVGIKGLETASSHVMLFQSALFKFSLVRAYKVLRD